MTEHAPQLDFAQGNFIDEVCEGRPRQSPLEAPHLHVERTAAEAPERVALRHRDATLGYGELNQRANQLAHLLASRGVGPGSFVVVCVKPGFDILIALLGILKAGATYVPLDPAYPAAHIRGILDDTRPALVIASRASLPLFEGRDVLLVDESAELLATYSGGDPALPVDREATAYVYYTSGTTGAPKGVMASYENLASYVTAARERYDLCPSDVMPALARFSFSISMFELMAPLSAGGTLLILDREHVLDPARLSDTLRDVTFFHAGPSLLRPILEHIKSRPDLGPRAFSGVRHASSGGDLIPPDVLESAKEIFPNAEVFVIYGCSEIACMGCTYEVPRDRRITKTFVGRPFEGTAVRLIDDALRRVEVGEVGEICFSGSGVVKGYLNRAELTREKFIDLEGRRFYRTGDMGRVTEEGFIQILGRSDFQAKIRGMRVEVGEVEYHLRRAPHVKEGVVMAREGAGGEKVLVAYVVLDAAAEPGQAVPRAAALRRHMVEHLPDYMVPAIYLELPKLPLNHNMKVDRRALPAPNSAPSSRGDRQPETDTERHLASLWKTLLHTAEVRLDDNFFELGGHSLLALRFLVELERAIGVALDGMDVLRESLEVLARICDERLGRPGARARARTTPRVAHRNEPFHFGPDESLYGVLTRPERPRSHVAVLVCAPVGQEKVRAQFVLQNLGRRLAHEGLPMLHFDHHGCGDSLGEAREMPCARWQCDIRDALAALVDRTGATRVVAVGARLGATLLFNAGISTKIAGMVLWDPILSGADHVSRASVMHRRQLEANEYSPGPLRALFQRRKPRPSRTELLGAVFSTEALGELRALSIARGARSEVPVRWLASSPESRDARAIERVRGADPWRVGALDVAYAWEDPRRLEDVLPDVGISAALATMIVEALE